ncbi:MAG: DUF5916 domain-containing protein [Gemmatimonadota bacterium]|nr:DUF5916 domain-containing protein [Gemmatimonadota bacterium]
MILESALLFAAAVGVQSPQQVGMAADSTLTHTDGVVPPTVTAVRADPAPVLDGILDDPVWQNAIPVTGFRRDRPGDGLPAAEKTEVRVAYTDDALYVGARMYDRDPSRISLLRGRRDSFMQSNDQFLIQLDSYHDHRTTFVFGVTPAGGRNDLVAPNDGFRGMDAGWDPVWDAATRVDSAGWVAELRIPFSQLRFREGGRQVWGVNFRRDILHAGEAVDWAWRPSTESGLASSFGHLLGLEGVRRPSRLEVLPYAVTRASFDQRADPASPFDDGSVYGGAVGLDLKYGLTGGLTLDATVNPDFGQVEADPAVVNLTAFETFFEERRPFFVEGAGLFGFGGLEGLRFFYSRRVGQRPAIRAIGPQGSFVDQPTQSTILGAAKISGRTDSGWVVAFMNATTQRENARIALGAGSHVIERPVEPLSNITALRLRRDMRDGDSYIGMIATGVGRDLNDDAFSGMRDRAVTGGVDFLHRFANRTYALQGWLGGSHIGGTPEAMRWAQYSSVRYYQRPDQDYVTFDPDRTSLGGYAGELALRKIAGEWLYGFEASMISPGFEMNDAGFQTIADIYSLTLGGTRRWVEPGRYFRSASLTLGGSERRNFGNLVFQREISLRGNGQTVGFHSIRGSLRYEMETLDHRTTRGGPAMVSPANWGGNLWFNTDGRKRVSGGLSVNFSGDAEGSYSIAGGPTLFGRGEGLFSWSIRPTFRRSMSAAFYVTQRDDPAAHATFGRRYIFAELEQHAIDVTIRMDLALTPRMTLQVYGQPFIATGDYENFMALRAPRTYDFLRYVTIGRSHATIFVADPDGTGPAAPIRFPNPDFRTRSFRSNVVLRWEYLPGSTLFLVWSQDRRDWVRDPAFDGVGELQRLFSDPMRNVFLIKASYWLDF